MLRALLDGLSGTSDDCSAYIDPDPARWMQTHFLCIDPDTGKAAPLRLYESQAIPLREALSTDANGLYRYSTVVWSAPKKTAKTLIAAAVCLYFMWQKPWRSAKCIGNDQRQASSRVFEFIKQAIKLHPRWSQSCKVTNNCILLPNNSKIEAVPIDPEGEAGAADDFVSYTELWGWRSRAEVRYWTESTLAPAKFGRSIRWVDSYAGEVGNSPILENLYDIGVRGGECINEQYEMYRNGRMFALWCTRHHLPLHTPEYLAQEAQNLTPSEYNRVHNNQWIAPSDNFVPLEWWDACRANLAPIGARDQLVVAMDAAVESDTFGVVAVSGLDGERYAVRYARRWKPPAGGKIDFTGTPDNPGPELEIRRLVSQYYVVEVCYDPYQLEDMASRLKRDGLCHVYGFKQTTERAVADKGLFDAIRERRIIHSGDVDLREHIANANQKAEGEKLRIVKRNANLKIDLAVSLSMALARAKYWHL